ncbi:phytochelatin synthase family protein [Plastorhodobacter daqingensis]|uniref:glutathione gamma-glutamylcysteinyltransferase n=1 Tax=Plastorhodobacter daqingensis TaxID=1387281 RepID=A0ABW2ULP1_9RHOB
MPQSLPPALISIALMGLGPMAKAEEALPKLGPDAVPLTAETTYLRLAPAADYWAFSAFVAPQITDSACSLAAVTAAINGLRGLPAEAESPILTQEALLDAVNSDDWRRATAQDGDGVRFDDLLTYTAAALAATGLDHLEATRFRPLDDSDDTRAALHALLEANEASAEDALLVYYNQGVVTGDWDGPHVALIGAYDLISERVLILEVDREWYIPYWTATETLLAAMLRPAPEVHGPLAGETGGLVHIHPAETGD